MKKLLYVIITFILFSCGGYDNNPEKYLFKGEEIEPVEKQNRLKNKNIINFGITPWQLLSEHKKGFSPILKYLSEKTGKKFVLNVSKDYDSLKNEVKRGDIQVAAFSPFAYVEALEKIPDRITYLATTRRKFKRRNIDYYRGYIIVREDSSIRTLDDLKMKSFGFVDKKSTSGYIFPLLLFKKNSIVPESFFLQVFFLGNHTKVVEAVLSGTIDAGAIWDGSFNVAIKKYGEMFRIIQKTDRIPLDAWVVSSSLDNEFIKELKIILININSKTVNSNNEKILESDYFPYTGFIVKDSSYYNVIKEAVKILNLEK